MTDMTDTEIIAAQTRLIASLEKRLTQARDGITQVRSIIYSIGGPLNDNKLQFTPAQQAVFGRIVHALPDPEDLEVR